MVKKREQERAYVMELSNMLAGEPYLVHLGMEVVRAKMGDVALCLPLRREVSNHLGLVHGGAQYALGEATAIALAAMLVSDQPQPVNLLTASASISYHRLAKGDLLGRATLPAEEQQRLQAIFAEKGRARIPVAVELVDETNEVVTTLTVECVALAGRASA